MKKQPNFLNRFCMTQICLLFVIVTTIGIVSAQNDKPQKEERYEKDIVAYEEQSQKTPPPEGCTMFVGSSTWRLWGKELEQDFAEFKAVNRGFGGSTIPDVLRVMHRIVLPHKPARIMFFCGGNDIAGGATGDETFKNFKTFIKRVWDDNPSTDVFFVSVTIAPSRARFRDETSKYNAQVKELAEKTPHLYYVDTYSTLVGDDGVAQEKYFLNDRLHLNKEGHDRWIPVIKKAINDVENTHSH